MKCDFCKTEQDTKNAQFSQHSMGFICLDCAKKQGMVWVDFTDHSLTGQIMDGCFFPKDWCPRTRGLRATCPQNVICYGGAPVCGDGDINREGNHV
jgi:hypothetical protein